MGAVAKHSEKRRAMRFQGPTRDPGGGKGHATDFTKAAERADTARPAEIAQCRCHYAAFASAPGDGAPLSPVCSVRALFCQEPQPRSQTARAVIAESRFVVERGALWR